MEKIPNGVYSVKQGEQPGVYIMLRMPEELSGEVFWRFYPLGDTAHPITSPTDVLKAIEADQEQMRHELPEDSNPFSQLTEPLAAAISQIGEAYVEEAMAAQTPDRFLTRLKRVLQRDDILKADESLWQRLNGWAGRPIPSDALRRRVMVDPARAFSSIRVNEASADEMLRVLRDLLQAIEGEGLDRPLIRPDTRQPSVRDLQLVAWELVVGADGSGSGDPQPPP